MSSNALLGQQNQNIPIDKRTATPATDSNMTWEALLV